MSWADIKRRYAESGGTASQSTEDMVARRILRAVGTTEDRLPALERDKGLDKSRAADTTLLERAIALARVASDTFRSPPAVVNVNTRKAAERALFDTVDGKSVKSGSAVVYRRAKDRELRVLMWLGDVRSVDVTELPLPCFVYRHEKENTVIAECDALEYFKKQIGGTRG